jgi:hypothetical protein
MTFFIAKKKSATNQFPLLRERGNYVIRGKSKKINLHRDFGWKSAKKIGNAKIFFSRSKIPLPHFIDSKTPKPAQPNSQKWPSRPPRDI